MYLSKNIQELLSIVNLYWLELSLVLYDVENQYAMLYTDCRIEMLQKFAISFP